MERLCLLIDNENQDTSAEKIIREGKSKGLAIQVHQFNVGHPELTEVLESGKIDITKVIDYYNANFRKFHYDIIAFDWDLNDEKIDGVELIRSFRSNNLIKKTNIVLYSGELVETVKGYFEEYREDPNTFKENWKKIKELIDTPIRGFFDRVKYEDKIVEELQLINKTIDIEQHLLKKLRENPDLIFNNINPTFEGMTFEKVAQIIENDIAHGRTFTSAFIEQAIALQLRLNPQD